MKNNKIMLAHIILIQCLLLFSCSKESLNNDINNNQGNSTENNSSDCDEIVSLDKSRGECDQILNYDNSVSFSNNQTNRTIQSNNIPDHKVGLFGRFTGSLNPNEIRQQNSNYTIALYPSESNSYISLYSSTRGPMYSFGILLNGVELDPVAAEPFPHEGMFSSNVNWEWNLEALNVNLGLDCNNAHVQPNGKYHYHGVPELYLLDLDISSSKMSLIGYAADGFPIYYKYAHKDPMDSNSELIEMSSSYRLKEGDRPGDGVTAPCGKYNGVYTNDYEYVSGLGDLDQANGRFGVSSEFPEGTYYYIITDDFPSIPRYFKGSPSNDFKIGI